MLDWIPIHAWLLLLIALFTWPAFATIGRRIHLSELNHDRPNTKLTIIAGVGAVLAITLAIFIFTPQAEAVAHSPQFWPMLIFAVLIYAAYLTVRGFVTGQAEPLVRGNWGPYSREESPRAYWISQVWNVFFIAVIVWLMSRLGVQFQ